MAVVGGMRRRSSPSGVCGDKHVEQSIARVGVRSEGEANDEEGC